MGGFSTGKSAEYNPINWKPSRKCPRRRWGKTEKTDEKYGLAQRMAIYFLAPERRVVQYVPTTKLEIKTGQRRRYAEEETNFKVTVREDWELRVLHSCVSWTCRCDMLCLRVV
jgi:hypothetical protein